MPYFAVIVGCVLLIAAVLCGAWLMASTPACTTYSTGDTVCTRYVTPFHREVWHE